MRTAVYPGSFDPPTNGHVHIMKRAARLFDQVVIGVGVNSEKSTLFSADERVEMLKLIAEDIDNIEVATFGGLLVEFAKDNGATVIVRGLRAMSDFENEFQMALANRELAPEVETVFLATSPEHMFVSSSIVKEIAALGGPVEGFVSPEVAKRLLAKQSR
ncbi:MAG: pantetheine-phosphate adenylyltransferase [Fimbriimonadales bacterium]